MSGEIVAVGRSADSIAMEIQVIARQAHRVVCSAAIEIGERLIEAKQLVPHGEWEGYVQDRCGFKPRTAQAYMQIAASREKAQSFADLEFSKVLLLLAMPEGQAEEFLAEHPAENVSVRKLKAQIAEYEERLGKAADAGAAQQQLLLLATEENGALKQQLEDIDADYKGQLDTVDRENDRLRAELEAVKNRPAEISEEEAAKLRAEGWGEGHREGLGEKTALEGQLEQLKNQMEEQSAAMGRTHHEVVAAKDEEIAELKRQLAAAAGSGSSADLMKNETVTVLAEVQAALNKMHGCYLKAQTGSPTLTAAIKKQAEKLIAALHSNFGIDYV